MPGRVLTIAAALSAALIAPTAAAAATYTVDPSAAAGCSASKVCKTISEANAAIADGDTVDIKPGTYKEPDSITVTKLNVTFKGAPGAVTITTASSTKGKAVFVLNTGSKLEGLTIGAQENGGNAVLVKGTDTTVTGCFLARIVTNDQNAAVYKVDPAVGAGTSTIASSFVLQAPVASPTELSPPAIQGNADSSIALIDDNVFSDAKLGSALELSGGTANTIIRSSLYASNPGADAIKFTSVAGSTGGKTLQLDSTLLAGGQNGAGIRATTEPGSILGSAPAGPITISGVHVTIAGSLYPAVLSSGTDVLAGDSGAVNVTLDRSIVHGKGSSSTGDRTNLTLTTSDVTDKSSSTIVLTGTQTTADEALFADAAKRNFHIRTNAPVIDKAGDITAGGSDRDFDLEPRKTGPATDMGADEFVNKAPRALLSASKTTAAQNEQVTFDASKSSDPEAKSGGGIKSYRWDFGDGQTTETTTATVQHSYAEIGSYEAKLTVVDSFDVVSNTASVGMTITDGIPAVIKIAAPKAGRKLHIFKTTVTKKTVTDPDGTKHVVRTKTRKRQTFRFAGTATDANGVKTVEMSLRRVRLGSAARASAKAAICVYLDGKKSFLKRNCKKPVYFYVNVKDGVFSFRTKRGTKFRAGTYELAVRATDGSGVVSPPTTVRFTLVK